MGKNQQKWLAKLMSAVMVFTLAPNVFGASVSKAESIWQVLINPEMVVDELYGTMWVKDDERVVIGRKDGKLALMGENMELLKKTEYDQFEDYFWTEHNLLVSKNQGTERNLAIIDSKGETVVELGNHTSAYENYWISEKAAYTIVDRIGNDSYYGVADEKGVLRIPVIYRGYEWLDNGDVVYKKKENDKDIFDLYHGFEKIAEYSYPFMKICDNAIVAGNDEEVGFLINGEEFAFDSIPEGYSLEYLDAVHLRRNGEDYYVKAFCKDEEAYDDFYYDYIWYPEDGYVILAYDAAGNGISPEDIPEYDESEDEEDDEDDSDWWSEEELPFKNVAETYREQIINLHEQRYGETDPSFSVAYITELEFGRMATCYVGEDEDEYIVLMDDDQNVLKWGERLRNDDEYVLLKNADGEVVYFDANLDKVIQTHAEAVGCSSYRMTNGILSYQKRGSNTNRTIVYQFPYIEGKKLEYPGGSRGVMKNNVMAGTYKEEDGEYLYAFSVEYDDDGHVTQVEEKKSIQVPESLQDASLSYRFDYGVDTPYLESVVEDDSAYTYTWYQVKDDTIVEQPLVSVTLEDEDAEAYLIKLSNQDYALCEVYDLYDEQEEEYYDTFRIINAAGEVVLDGYSMGYKEWNYDYANKSLIISDQDWDWHECVEENGVLVLKEDVIENENSYNKIEKGDTVFYMQTRYEYSEEDESFYLHECLMDANKKVLAKHTLPGRKSGIFFFDPVSKVVVVDHLWDGFCDSDTVKLTEEKEIDVETEKKSNDVSSGQKGSTTPSQQTDDTTSSGQKDGTPESEQADSTTPAQQADSTTPAQQATSKVPTQRADSTTPAQQADSTTPAQQADSTIPVQQADSTTPTQQTGGTIPAQQADGAIPAQQSTKSQTNVVMPLSVGTIITDEKNNCKVKVTSNSEKPTVSFIKNTNKKAKKVTVPDSVTYNNVTYKVTSIAANAFAKSEKVEQVVVGKNITSVGKKAFYNAKKLKNVTLKSGELTKIGENAFSGCKKLTKLTISSKKLTKKSVGKNALKGTSKELIIKVPKAKKSAYKKILLTKGNKNLKIK